jgi:phage gp29-like protein
MIAEAANRLNGRGAGPTAPPKTEPLFDADSVKMLRMMRVNPLPMLDPQSLGVALDQFDTGMLRMAALLWDAMCRRDDTLVTVKPQLENEVASRDWGIFPVKGADEKEAARHVAALEYFYNNLTATDAFDRNERGGRDKLIEQMMQADSFKYAVHHLVWRPQPGKMIDVDGADPVPALTATLEYVPLWFFENTTGQLRFLKDGGFGVDGVELDWESGEWMVTAGRGLMFAASICYTFKRLTFQDWTIFNERYAQNKVVGTTPGDENSSQARSLRAVLENFNSDQAILITEFAGDASKPPIALLGPTGTASVEIFEKFIDRQDRKLSSMYRGNDLSMMSRGGRGENPTGASLQEDEGDAMLRGACRRIAGTCQEFIDRTVIRFCFGEDVQPLAYFGLPELDKDDVAQLRESAGFLADRGARVSLPDTAERLGVQLVPKAEKDEEILQPAIKGPAPGAETIDEDPDRPGGKPAREERTDKNAQSTENAAADPDLEAFLDPYVSDFRKAFADDLQPLRIAMEHVVGSPNAALQIQNMQALRGLLPELLKEINRAPKTVPVLVELMKTAMQRGASLSPATPTPELAVTAR